MAKFTVIIKTEDNKFEFCGIDAQNGQEAIAKVDAVSSIVNICYKQAICEE